MRHFLTITETASTIASNLNENILSQKDLTSQGDLLKKQENLNETTQEPQILSPLEQANAEKLLKLESERLASEQEFLKAKEQESKKLNLIFELI